MKKILKTPNNLVRRVLSRSSDISQSSSHENKTRSKKKSLMTEEQQLATEIKALKVQIENLKAAINTLQEDTESKEVAIARIAREKEKITMELLKQRRSNDNLLKQLEDERKFYYKEKEQYCQEMNQFKRLKQVISSASVSKDDPVIVEQYKKEIAKIKQTLNQTLEANYNLSIKFLRMKNTKTCLKTELKTMQLEHEKLVNDYKTKIHSLSGELNELIQDRLNSPISCSSKKYLHLVKQNSCLVYENLCLQLEVDNLHLKCEKLKLEKTKSETNSRLKYIKHDSAKAKISKKSGDSRETKRVRIREERPEKLEKNTSNVLLTNQMPSTSQMPSTIPEKRLVNHHHDEILKIFERNQLPGIPDIKMMSDVDTTGSYSAQKDSLQIPSVQENLKNEDTAKKNKLLRNVLEKPNSKLELFQVSNVSSKTSTITNGSLLRVHSSPDIVGSSGEKDWSGYKVH